MAISKINFKLNLLTNDSASRESRLSTDILKQKSATTTRSDSLSINRLAEIADSANAEIQKLREQQLTLAEEVDFANNAVQSSISERIASLQEEIERIGEAATYNGQSALNGGTFTVSQSSTNTNQIVSLANTSYAQKNYNVDVDTTAGVTDAITNLSDAVQASRVASDSSESSLNKSTSIISALSASDKNSGTQDSEQSTVELSEIAANFASELVSEDKIGVNSTKTLIETIKRVSPESDLEQDSSSKSVRSIDIVG